MFRAFHQPAVLTLIVSGVLLGCASLSLPVQAQTPPMFENASLSPGFSPDPTELRGIGGGAVSAKKVAGQAETSTGKCLGYVESQPNHTLKLTAYFRYLKVQVQSSEDTTIVVKGPGGTWCNDDLEDQNAGMAGEWLDGTYEVWVGTYGKNQAIPYTLKITERR